MIKFYILATLLVSSLCAPQTDRMKNIPGYPSDYPTALFTGYLEVQDPKRGLHYVFVESARGQNNKDPITLWLNGGPGCSSLLGFLQEIGPYYLEDGIDWKQGNNLTENKYSWHKESNLLFFQSPAGVGYSYNLNQGYVHTDGSTAMDNLNALVDFFNKFQQYRGRKLWIAGESYAGKYIPDLAVLIDKYNRNNPAVPINLIGLLIGNGIMTFQYLQDSTYDFHIDRSFVDPDIVHVYQTSCKSDPDSASCRYFQIQFDKGTDQLNPYNVYGYCYYNDSFATKPNRKMYKSQESILMDLKKTFSNDSSHKQKFNGAPCAYFDGVYDYFNLNQIQYKAKFPGQVWNGPCAQKIIYSIDPAGSIQSYRYLLGLIGSSKKYTIILYNGDWDSVVPYQDTIKGIQKLNLVETYTHNPWFTDGQHSGFQQLYSGILFVTFKGASHQVPQSKRAEAFDLFNSTLQGHTDGDFNYEKIFPKTE